MARSAGQAAAIKRERREEAAAPLAPQLDEGTAKLLKEAGLYHEPGFAMRMAQLAVFEDVLARLADLKLTLSQLSVLRLIKVGPTLQQQHIGDALRIKKTNLVALINKLEDRGLVSRAILAKDRRAYTLYLTAKGERILAAATEAVCAHLNVVSQILPRKELERLIESLWKVALTLPRANERGASR